MTDFASTDLPPPSDEKEFERCIAILFQCVLGDPQTKVYGRSGQKQRGVDVYGRRMADPARPWVGIQCKVRKQSLKSKLTKQEVLDEVDEAKAFEPRLSELYIVTTAPDDTQFDDWARDITAELAETDHPMSVVIWGWGTICSHTREHERAFKAFHPDHSPLTDTIIESIEALEHKHDQTRRHIEVSTARIEKTITTGNREIQETIQAGNEGVEREFHQAIDEYRELGRARQPKTALSLLTALKERIWNEASGRVRYRLLSNIASAQKDLGQTAESARNLLEAYALEPDNIDAKTNAALAYLMLDDAPSAFRIASEAVSLNPLNDGALVQLLQAAARDEDHTDPWGLIPKAAHSIPAAHYAAALFFRHRSNPAWMDVVSNAQDLFPDHDELQDLAAEAVIERGLSTEGVLIGERIDDAPNVEQIRAACVRRQTLWHTLHNSEVTEIDPSLPHNLAQGYRLLGELDAAAAVLDAAIDAIPDCNDFYQTRVVLYVGAGDIPAALELLAEAPDHPQNRLLAIELTLDDDPARALDALLELRSELNVARIGFVADALIAKCYVLLDRTDDAIAHLQSTVDATGTVEAFSHLARLCHDLDHPSKDVALECALEAVNDSTPFFVRFELATLLDEAALHESAFLLLHGHVDTTRDTPTLRLYLKSLVHSDRRTQARETFEAMPEALKDKPYFLYLQSLVHTQRGDLQGALDVTNRYIEQRPTELWIRLRWAQYHLRLGDAATVREFLKTDLNTLEGDPDERMVLAQLAFECGEFRIALDLGYRLAKTTEPDPQRLLSFAVMVMTCGDGPSQWLSPATIDCHTTFHLRGENGEKAHFTIEPDAALRTGDHDIPPDHLTAKAAFGKPVGDAFDVTVGAGGRTKTWTIAGILHKYITEYQRIMALLEDRFPDFLGFEALTFDPNGDQPLKEFEERTRKSHEQAESLLDIVEKNRLPLACLAASRHTSVFSIWQAYAQSGRRLAVCEGNHAERERARDAIKENASRGCIVDTLTAHLIRFLNVVDAVEAVCGPIGVTQSTIDEFREELRELERLPADGRGGQAGWRDGRLVFQETTPEMRARWIDTMRADIAWLTEACTLIPAEADQDVPHTMRGMSSAVDDTFLDPILAADGSNRLLLAEERSFRVIGASELGLRGVWLQPVLLIARDQGHLSNDAYCDAMNQLIYAGHETISVDTAMLVRASEQAIERGDDIHKSIFARIGGANAEMRSHLSVSIGFINHVWSRPSPSLAQQAHTGELLRCLIAGRQRDWFAILSSLEKRAHSAPSFRQYLRCWWQGHFLPREQPDQIE